ncbi:two-component system sensor histidine kinase [Streptomyces sannanensis]|uniref:Two-component system sensor histidine kinase n=1 Tax=Streptomyces sannanensis TaxID=285536 RepID=A0ABP6S5J2_9ACTN
MHSLLDAVMNLGRGLELPQVLRGIVEAAVTLTDAEYGALGVVGDGQRLSQFLPVGMADEMVAAIGQTPCGRGILGELIHNPVPLRLDDLSQHRNSYGFPAHHPPMRTFLGVPVRVRDEVFGNLYLTEKRGGRGFDADDEAVLTTLSIAAGVAIDNARMYHESRRRERWLEALGEITRSLLSGIGADHVLRLIAERARDVAGADAAAVLLPDPEEPGRLAVRVACGHDADRMSRLAVPVRGSLSGMAAHDGRPAVSADLSTDPRGNALGDDRAAYGPTVAVPLPVGASASGALRLSRLSGGPEFDATEVQLISGFAGQAALALELAQRRAESEELALMHDRDRIARDLHDLAIQRLFATGMTLQSAQRGIERPEMAERVGRAVRDLDTTIDIIRSTIFDLRSDTDDRGGPGVRRRMAETARSATQSLGFTPSLLVNGPVDTNISAELAEHVLAVATEALSNAARHAAARRVDIVLTAEKEITLTVTDDGVGIGSATPTGGLTNMRERAELLGGSLTVTSPPAGGTRIEWRVPLPAN